MEKLFPAAAGLCGLGAAAALGVWLRPRFPVSVNCWFCGGDAIVPFGNRNCWDCPRCEQYNGFRDDGNYNKVIPAQFAENLNSLKGVRRDVVEADAAEAAAPAAPSGFCADCNRNQLLKIKQLAAFAPLNEETFDEEADRFRKRLDVSLALCGACQARAETTLDRQNRELMYNIAADAISNRTSRRRRGSSAFSVGAGNPSPWRRRLTLFVLGVVILVLCLVAASSALSLCFRHLRTMSSGPQLFSSLPPRLRALLSLVLSLAESRSLLFVFSGVFLAIGSVILKMESSYRVGHRDLILVAAWMFLLGVRLRRAFPRVFLSVGVGAEDPVHSTAEALASASTLLHALGFLFQRPTRRASGKRAPIRDGRGGTWGDRASVALWKLARESASSPETTSPSAAQPLRPSVFDSASPPPAPPSFDGAVFPTSTPPSSSRPPTPTGSILGEGVELRTGDLAGMTLSTGLTPKKNRGDVGGGAAAAAAPPAAFLSLSSIWGNVGLNSSISSSGSSMTSRKTKTIISPARFTAVSSSSSALPSALFGSRGVLSAAALQRRDGASPPAPDSRTPLLGSLSGPGIFSVGVDDALSTVSAPSRFAMPTGVGLFPTASVGKGATPRGSDNTSSTDRDWPPRLNASPQPPLPSKQHAARSFLGRWSGAKSLRGVPPAPPPPPPFDDTFTDDSDSENICLADVSAMKRRRGGVGKRSRGVEGSSGGGLFVKVFVVVSVVCNVFLAFYLGTLMKVS